MHHAYLYLGSLSQLAALAENAKTRFGFEGEHNPDMQIRTYEKFGIDEARELSAAAGLRSMSGRSLSIIGVSQINTEAQQALLKLFEEPQEGAIFVLLAPHGSIIPTLKSRFLRYEWEVGGIPPAKNTTKRAGPKAKSVAEPVDAETLPQGFISKFLASSTKLRSAEITKLLKDEDGERERVRDFLQALEAELHKMLLKKPTPEVRAGLEDIAKVRSYVGDRSPSLKMLLEHLALALPQLK